MLGFELVDSGNSYPIMQKVITLLSRLRIYQVFFLVALLYFLLPTTNSTLDAYAYASYVKYNDLLFTPHHLLYNPFIYIVALPLNAMFPSVEQLLIGIYINSLFSLLSLFVLALIVKKLLLKKEEIILFILIAAFSFSPWRFGTENETYIMPIFFSLLGSLYFLKYLISEQLSFIFLSGLFVVLACLFHQIHFFWWLGLLSGVLFYSKNLKAIALFLFPIILIPFAYILALSFYYQMDISIDSMLRFVFQDYYQGTAKTQIGVSNFILLAISSVRTFFQVHPNIIFLVKRNIVYSIPLLMMFIFLWILVKNQIRKNLLSKRKDTRIPFVIVHTFILVFHVLFAFVAVGNIEFLVMTPFLLLLTLFYYYKINIKVLFSFVSVLLIWNLFYAILPNHMETYFEDDQLVEFILDHPDDHFVVDERVISNKFFYKTGVDTYKNIHFSDKIDIAHLFEEELIGNDFFYTNIIDKPEIFNRAKLMSTSETKNLLSGFMKMEVFSYGGLYGRTPIYKVYRN